MRYSNFKDPDTLQPNRFTLPTYKRKDMNRHMTRCDPSHQDYQSKLARFKSGLQSVTSHLNSHEHKLEKLHNYMQSLPKDSMAEPEIIDSYLHKPPIPLLSHRTWNVAQDFKDKISQINTLHILDSIHSKSSQRHERSQHLSELRKSTEISNPREVKELYTNSLYVLHN